MASLSVHDFKPEETTEFYDSSANITPLESGARTPVDERVPIGSWYYDPRTNLWDVSRSSPTQMTLACDPERLDEFKHGGVTVDPAATCLIIVDMQNYFIDPSYHHHPAGLAAVQPIINTIAKCREAGVQIIWLNWVTNEKEMLSVPASVQRAFSDNRHFARGHGWGVNLGTRLENGERVLFDGTTNADIYAPLKAVSDPINDIFCHKSRMSGMWSDKEDLYKFLCKDQEIPSPQETGHSSADSATRVAGSKYSTLMFAGINTDQCLLSTLTNAHSFGWDCILLSDCSGTATKTPGAQAVSEGNIATNMGFVITSEAFCNAKVVKSDKVACNANTLADALEKELSVWDHPEEKRHDSGWDFSDLTASHYVLVDRDYPQILDCGGDRDRAMGISVAVLG